MASLDAGCLVGQLATECPGGAEVFERHGIDYFTAGDRTLQAACAADDAALDAVLRELDAAGEDEAHVDWSRLGMGELVDHIVETHHAYLRSEFPRLHSAFEKLLAALTPEPPELRDLFTVFQGLRAELEQHMMKEEEILFPIVKELEAGADPGSFHCGSVQNPIGVMKFEHDNAGRALRRIRDLTANLSSADDRGVAYGPLFHDLARLERDLHTHIHKENNILFPGVLAMERAAL